VRSSQHRVAHTLDSFGMRQEVACQAVPQVVYAGQSMHVYYRHSLCSEVQKCVITVCRATVYIGQMQHH
jgi:hypothetical protein